MFAKHVLGGVLVSAIAASAWTIEGHTYHATDGAVIPEVMVTTMNYTGFSTTTDAEGHFFLSNEGSTAVQGRESARIGVRFEKGFLNIANAEGREVKVSLMDAQGRIVFQQKYSAHNILVELRKFSHQKMMIVNISGKSSESYILSQNGSARVLAKEGELAPVLFCNKEGYRALTYNAKSDNERDVALKMYKDGEYASSSSAAEAAPGATSAAGSSAASTASGTSAGSSAASGASAESGSSANSSNSVTAPSSTSQTSTENVKPATVLAPGDYNKDVNGRLYIVHVPSTYTGETAVPLLVDYHPLGGNASAWINSSPYKDYVAKDAAIVIYPNGDESVWNVGSCCNTSDDESFTRSFVAEVKKIAYIDSKRIYATGFSMGGGMSQFAACNMADIFAAIAPAGFDLAEENVNNCHPSRPISIISFRGQMDGVVTYQGHAAPAYPDKPLTFLGAQDNHKKWAELNGCTGSPVPDSEGCSVYENCSAGTKVVLCTDKNGTSDACEGNGHDAGCPRIGWPFLMQFTMP